MTILEDQLILSNICELREILTSADGMLIKSRISPEDYFTNLSYGPLRLRYDEVGISKLVVSICELVSNLLLEDTDESRSVSKAIVMIFEHYFLVSPILFKGQSARLVNDMIFMKHFMKYVQSLFLSRTQAQKELGNILASLNLERKIENLDII